MESIIQGGDDVTALKDGGLAEAPDGELARLALKRPEAFGVLFDRHFEAVLRFLQSRVASAETAADLAAETFAQALLSLARFRRNQDSARLSTPVEIWTESAG
ncbi:MAG: RNA polymerase sigma factor [Actinomycetota bacterium]